MCKVKVHKRIGSDAMPVWNIHYYSQIPHTTNNQNTMMADCWLAIYPLSLFSTQKPSSTLSWLYGIVPKHFPFLVIAYILPCIQASTSTTITTHSSTSSLLTFYTLHTALPLSSSTSSFQKIFKIRLTGHWAHKYCDWMCVYEILLRFFPISSPQPSFVFIKERKPTTENPPPTNLPSACAVKAIYQKLQCIFHRSFGDPAVSYCFVKWRGENIYIPPFRNDMMMICTSREGGGEEREKAKRI